MADKLKALESENRELRQANEILRKASRVFCLLSRFASKPLLARETELDRLFKK